jgi:hypothetical protein
LRFPLLAAVTKGDGEVEPEGPSEWLGGVVEGDVNGGMVWVCMEVEGGGV